MLLTIGCGTGDLEEVLLPPAGEPLVIVATAADDYSVGTLSAVSLNDWTIYGDIATVSGDPVVQAGAEHVYQINRLGTDTIRVYDPEDWTRPIEEFSVGGGANPHSVVECGEELWVSLYEESALGRYRDGMRVDQISVAAFADADGIPESSDMARVGDRVYVAFQRLNRNQGWAPESTGRVASYDCETGAVLQSFEVGANPRLIIGSDESVWTVSAEAGIQRIDPVNDTVEDVFTEFSGHVASHLAMGENGRGLLITRGANYEEYAVSCVEVEASNINRLLTVTNYLPDVQVHQGQGWVAARRSFVDESTLGGLMVVDLESCTLLTDPAWLQTPLDPVSIAFTP